MHTRWIGNVTHGVETNSLKRNGQMPEERRKQRKAAIHGGYSKYTRKNPQPIFNLKPAQPKQNLLQYNNVLKINNEKMGTSSSNSPPPQPAL